MKKIFAILSVAATALMMVVSCAKEQEAPHQPGQPDVANCYGVFFPVQEATGYHIYDPTQDLNATFTIGRTNSQGAITVPVVVEASADNVFEIATISFADGQTETTFDVNMKNVEDGKLYDLHLEVTDPQYASLYAANTKFIDFSFMRVKMEDFLNPKTGEPAVITLNEGWWGEVHLAKMKYYEVDNVRTCTIYSIEEGKGIWGDAVDATLEFRWYLKNSNNEGHNFLEVQKQYFGFDYSDWASKPLAQAVSPIFVYDYPWYWIERGYAWGDGDMQDSWLAEATLTGQVDGSYPVGYYDGNGGFIFNLRYYIPGLGGFSPDPYEFVAIADGFVRVDYSFEAEADYSVDGITPIYLEAGMDVASIKYAVYEGELSSIQIANKAAAIADGTEASESFSDFEIDEEEAVKYATLGLSPEATGIYTFVAVAYDKDNNVQNNAGVSFTYISADDEEEYAVDLYVFTEDTPARYANYHDYDSFAYGIIGTGLTEVHMGIFKFEDVAQDPDAYFNAVKLDEDGDYAVSEETLAQINGEGGYYTVATNMAAKTEFVVLVWATNGSLEAWDYDTYTTEPLPYVWNSLGKGTLTDGFLMPLFGMDDITVNCDVYEEANTPGLYMVTGFQLALCAYFYETDPKDLEPYEGYNWWYQEIIVDATDPEAVHIGEQDYGIYVNSTYGYVMIDSDPVGTLADGAITFPAREMYIGLTNAGWYYANTAGTFKITLPSVNLSAPAIAPASTGNTIPTNFVMTRDAKSYEKPSMKFERDPKPVKASVKVDYTRKEKNADKKVIVSDKSFEVR